VIAHLAYLWYVLRHKWFVFVECCKLGIPWLGVIHDLSKFRPSEWVPYMHHFYNTDGSKHQRDKTGKGYVRTLDMGDAAFDTAVTLHYKRNKHHWQWYLLPANVGGIEILSMPERYCREMLADWHAASWAQGYQGEIKSWYEHTKDNMQLHPETRRWIEEQLALEVEA